MEKRLTDNEIIKALKCVPKHVSGYIIDENNKMKLVYNEDVIDLINRLQAENKRLEKEVNLVSIQFQDLQERYEESQMEIERLKK